jgi:hypothetical protein
VVGVLAATAVGGYGSPQPKADCPVSADRSDIDVNANPSMYTKTLGSGWVVLFRGGKHVEGTWSRPSSSAPTTCSDAAGNPLLLAPGGTFVALVRPGAPA